MKLLDLGCGVDKIVGAIGLDKTNLPDVDVVHNLNKFPYPFPDDEFDAIFCRHILEHVDDLIKTLEELYRIGKPGSKIYVIAPYFSSLNTFTDPTHKRAFTEHSFDYFTASSPFPHYSNKVKLKIKNIQLIPHIIEYRSGIRYLFLNFLIAVYRLIPDEIKKSFLLNVYDEIKFEMEIIKS